MKNFIKKITAVVLVLVMCFSVAAPSAYAYTEKENTVSNFEEYREIIEKGGFPALSSKQFVDVVKAINTVIRLLTGRGFVKQEYFNFTADEILTGICNEIAGKSGFDILMIVSQFPETNQYAEFVTETFRLDTTELRNRFYELRYEEDANGNHALACFYYFLGLYFSVIEECSAYCVPLEEENCYEIHLKIRVKDGTEEDIGTGVILNTETKMVYGDSENGMADIGFDFDYDELLLYAQVKVWMRDFGFTFLYDLFCYTTPLFFYNTRRIKFDYEGLEWMVQIWKGNYLISNGAEVGIYTREPGSLGTYYNCANDEQMMNMSMKLYHGDELLLERPEQLHWWVTGFKISDVLYPASRQTLDFTIEMKDEAMLEAFCEAIDNHYRHDMQYTVDGLKVNVIW